MRKEINFMFAVKKTRSNMSKLQKSKFGLGIGKKPFQQSETVSLLFGQKDCGRRFYRPD